MFSRLVRGRNTIAIFPHTVVLTVFQSAGRCSEFELYRGLSDINAHRPSSSLVSVVRCNLLAISSSWLVSEVWGKSMPSQITIVPVEAYRRRRSCPQCFCSFSQEQVKLEIMFISSGSVVECFSGIRHFSASSRRYSAFPHKSAPTRLLPPSGLPLRASQARRPPSRSCLTPRLNSAIFPASIPSPPLSLLSVASASAAMRGFSTTSISDAGSAGSNRAEHADYLILGGGPVGGSTAWQLAEKLLEAGSEKKIVLVHDPTKRGAHEDYSRLARLSFDSTSAEMEVSKKAIELLDVVDEVQSFNAGAPVIPMRPGRVGPGRADSWQAGGFRDRCVVEEPRAADVGRTLMLIRCPQFGLDVVV